MLQIHIDYIDYIDHTDYIDYIDYIDKNVSTQRGQTIQNTKIKTKCCADNMEV